MADEQAQPSVRRIAKPTVRDQRSLSSRFADFSPAKMGVVIRETERGIIESWADLCDRMVVDATVKAAYETRLAAVSGSRRVVEPGHTGDPARDMYAEDARAFVEQVLNDTTCFDDVIQDLLDGIGKGLSVAEIDWQYVSGNWVPAHIWWIHTRRFRYSPTWEPMIVDTGDRIYPNGLALEPGKFLVHQPKTVAGYPMLTGVMRSVAWPYLFKRLGQEFWLNGAERFAWPFMHAEVQRDAPAEVRAKALDAMEQLSADHVAVLEAGTAFKLVESTMKDGGTWRDLHTAMNGEIVKAINGMSDLQDPGKVGAYGAVEARKGATVDARIALDERQLASMIRRDLTTHLIKFNRHRWNGVMAPVPHVHWAVAHKRTEIPVHMLSSATTNERRESINLAKVDGGDDLPRVTDAQMGKFAEILMSIESGERTPALGAMLLRLAAPALTLEECHAFATAAAESAPPAKPADELADTSPEETLAEGADADDVIEVGAEWIDTEDDHRLKVTRVTSKNVFLVDLDSANPKRQFGWTRAYFVERCTPAPAGADAA